MQACRRGSHTTFDFGIDGLVGAEVAGFGLTVEVWRNRKLAAGIKDLCPGDVLRIPAKMDAVIFTTCYTQRKLAAIDGDCASEKSGLPFLAVAHEAMPGTGGCLLEHQDIVIRLGRFEAEDFDEGSGLTFGSCLAEMEACLNDTRVVHHEQRTFGQQLRQIAELAMADAASVIDQQLGSIALSQRIFGNSLIWQVVCKIGNA